MRSTISAGYSRGPRFAAREGFRRLVVRASSPAAVNQKLLTSFQRIAREADIELKVTLKPSRCDPVHRPGAPCNPIHHRPRSPLTAALRVAMGSSSKRTSPRRPWSCGSQSELALVHHCLGRSSRSTPSLSSGRSVSFRTTRVTCTCRTGVHGRAPRRQSSETRCNRPAAPAPVPWAG